MFVALFLSLLQACAPNKFSDAVILSASVDTWSKLNFMQLGTPESGPTLPGPQRHVAPSSDHFRKLSHF